MTDREIMQQALDALIDMSSDENSITKRTTARKALRQALAQPEQEPVCDKDPSLCGFTLCQLAKVCKHTPRNTMPTKIVGPNLEQILNAAGFYKREWVGLTDDEVDACFEDHGWSSSAMYYLVANALEFKLKEKNT